MTECGYADWGAALASEEAARAAAILDREDARDLYAIHHRERGHAGFHWMVTFPGPDGRIQRTWCPTYADALARQEAGCP